MSRRGVAPDLSGSSDALEPFPGDALEPIDVRRALIGVDVVVQALGVPPSLDLLLRPVTLFSAATRVLLSAMEETGVRKLVAVTGFGAGDSNESINILQRLPFKILLQNAYDDKTRQEQLIVNSNLDWLIVRPGVLTNFPPSSSYKILTEPKSWRNGVIARADVADFIVARITANVFNREKPVLIRCPL
jgi:putative NADH-flavin reductase